MSTERIAIILVASALAFLGGYLADRHYAKKPGTRRIREVRRGDRSITYVEDESFPAFLARAAMFFGFWAGTTMLALTIGYYLAPKQLPCAAAEQGYTDQVEHGADKARTPRVTRHLVRAAHMHVDPGLQRVIAPFANADEEGAESHQSDRSVGHLQRNCQRSDECGTAKPSDRFVPVVDLQLLHHVQGDSPGIARMPLERNA